MKQEELEYFDGDMANIEFEMDEDLLSEWPKTVDTYVHGSKEYGGELGEELGLDGDALQEFMYLHYEVKLTIKVEENGSYIITHVDDRPVLLDPEE